MKNHTSVIIHVLKNYRKKYNSPIFCVSPNYMFSTSYSSCVFETVYDNNEYIPSPSVYNENFCVFFKMLLSQHCALWTLNYFLLGFRH